MSVLNQSGEEQVECPLCMEPLEVDDLNFFPCTCGYQICRFCWHRIRTDENGLCPACRKAYPENPADFKPLTQEEVAKLKAEKRHKDQQRKQKITENRKHLANVRVVQRNLVFVVGLPMRLADSEVLKKHEYFGKFGKIHKVVINQSTSYAGSQGPSASAYVTYHKADDALRAIQAVNNISVDGRTVKTSLGTTKYCSHFMKNQTCPKPDCMYLHDLGDVEASFTKEEMQQGKHQEYERKLHEQLLNNYNQGNKDRKPTPFPPAVSLNILNCKVIHCRHACSGPNINSGSMQGSQCGSKEAWPSLQPGVSTLGCSGSSSSSISSNSSVSSNSNGTSGHSIGNSGCNSNNNSGGNNSYHGSTKGENMRRQKYEHASSKGNSQNHKKRHCSEDYRGKAKDKLHNALEDHQNKTVHNKANHNNRVNTKSLKEVNDVQKMSVMPRSQNQATALSDVNVSVENQTESMGIRVDSEVCKSENDVNVASSCIANESSTTRSVTGGRALSTSHRAATFFEPDNNSFFSSNSFTKVSASASGSAGPEWALSSLTLAHMPDVLPPVHSSEDWQAAFGFSNSGPSKHKNVNPAIQTVSEKLPSTGVESSVSNDSESCDSVTFESRSDTKTATLIYSCQNSHSSSTENINHISEEFRLSEVGHLNQKLKEFNLENVDGTECNSRGPVLVTDKETSVESIGVHSTGGCENPSIVPCSPGHLYHNIPSQVFQDPALLMVNRHHPYLPSSSVIPNGIQPLHAAKFLSEFHLRQQNHVQTSQPLLLQIHNNAIFENTNYSKHMPESSSNKLGTMNVNSFGESGGNTNSSLPKSGREIHKLPNGTDCEVEGENSSRVSEDEKYFNYESLERQKSCENSPCDYSEYNGEHENGVSDDNEELPTKENQRPTDDDLGFDPFHETQKALAEMMEKENTMLMLHAQQNHVSHSSQHMNHINQLHQQFQHVNHLNHHPSQFQQPAVFTGSKILPAYNAPVQPHHVLPHRLQANASAGGGCNKLLDGVVLGPGSIPPRARLPPPGFATAPNHMNAFGLGIPRAPTNTGSKILPFMGLGNSSNQSSNGASSPIPQPVNTVSINISISPQNVSSAPILFPHAVNSASNPNHLTNSFSVQNGVTAPKSSVPKSSSENLSAKEWPDNLRSLLPALNGGNRVSQSPVPVAFSGSNTPTPPPNSQNSTFAGSTHAPMPSNTAKSWSGAGPCSDWTALDPAIMSSRPHNYLGTSTVTNPQHPVILCNSNGVINQQTPNTQFMHLQNTTQWLRSLASDGCLLYGANISQNASNSEWTLQNHGSPNSIAPPPPGFSLRMTAQPTAVPSKLTVSSQEIGKIENI